GYGFLSSVPPGVAGLPSENSAWPSFPFCLPPTGTFLSIQRAEASSRASRLRFLSSVPPVSALDYLGHRWFSRSGADVVVAGGGVVAWDDGGHGGKIAKVIDATADARAVGAAKPGRAADRPIGGDRAVTYGQAGGDARLGCADNNAAAQAVAA